MKAPEHIGEGMEQGFVSIYNGFETAVTGLIDMPKKEWQKEPSTNGLIKGVFKGITGLITKPITGTFDATAKTT